MMSGRSAESEVPGRLQRSSAEATALLETSFFRDRDVFEALRKTVLPQLISRNAEGRTLKVLCAGVSTGQEAYSMAMLLRSHLAEQLANWDVKISGIDLSAEALRYASRGRYRRAEVNRGLPARMLVRYFARNDEEWEVAHELRQICEFREADVRVPQPGQEKFDLVLMRNLLLFLSVQERAGTFAILHRQMASHGFLALGQAEQAEDSTDLFEPDYVGGYCFYRPVRR